MPKLVFVSVIAICVAALLGFGFAAVMSTMTGQVVVAVIAALIAIRGFVAGSHMSEQSRTASQVVDLAPTQAKYAPLAA